MTRRRIYVCRVILYLPRDTRLGIDGRAARSVCSGIRSNYSVVHVLVLGDAFACLMVVGCLVRLIADMAGNSKPACTVSDTFTALL